MERVRGLRVGGTRLLIITKHAQERMGQRMKGTPAERLERVKAARQHGARLEHITGLVRMYILAFAAVHRGFEPILWRCMVYVFKPRVEGDYLVTVWHMPKPLRAQADEYDRKERRRQRSGA